MTVITFPEWASDDYFYDSLTEGETGALSDWQRYRLLISLEAMDLLDMQSVLSRLASEESIAFEEAEALERRITTFLRMADDDTLSLMSEELGILLMTSSPRVSCDDRDLFEAILHQHGETLAGLTRQLLGSLGSPQSYPFES